MTSTSSERASLNDVVDGWKEAVLDLTRRNSLIDFTETKTKSLPLTGSSPTAIGASFESNDRLPLRKREDDGPDQVGSNGVDCDELERVRGVTDGEQRAKNHPLNEERLVADRAPEAAAESLREIEQYHRRYLRERGVDTLYLSLGRLRWTRPGDDEPLRSPLFLLPVDLESVPANGTAFHDSAIAYTGDPATANPALQKKLRVEHDLALPVGETVSLGNLRDAFEAVEEVAESVDGWTVSRAVALCIFDFADYCLYEDIERNRDAIVEDPIIRAIAGDSDAIQELDDERGVLDGASEARRDDRYQVLEADPSQRRAIDAAVAGESFVLQGPPGTGKSQTIANIVAEKIARGERVLFVSEKQAALDVVRSRLESVDLERFCLELHGRQATRSSVLESLESALHVDADSGDPDDFEGSDGPDGPADSEPSDGSKSIREKRDEVGRTLSRYAEVLRSPPEGFDVTPYEALGIVARSRELPAVDAGLSAPLKHDQDTVDDAIDRLKELSTYEDPIRNRHDHPWRHTTIETWRIDTREQMRRSLDRQLDALESMRSLAERLKDQLGMVLEGAADIDRVRSALETLAFAPADRWSPVLLDSAFYEQGSQVRRLAETMVELTDLERGLRERYHSDLFDEDGYELHRELCAYGRLRYVQPEYYRLRRRLRSYARDGYEPTLSELRTDARTLRTIQSLRETARELEGKVDKRYIEPFEDVGDGDVDWMVLLATQDLLCALASRDVVAFSSADEGVTRTDLAAVRELYQELNSVAGEFESAVGFFEQSMAVDGIDLDDRPLRAASIETRCQYLRHLRSNLDRLKEWVQFRNRRAEAVETIAGEYLENFLEAGHDPTWLAQGFRRTFYRAWLNALYDRTPLSSFNAREFDRHLETYRRLDREAVAQASDAVVREITRGREGTNGDSVDSTELTALKRECSKRRHHRPLRELFADADSAVQELKPCFMTSPRAVARLLPRDSVSFDVVVFDESSQIPPAKAVSALLRAEQVIVAGDSKQLPPTRFFDTDVGSDRNRRVDLESILDEAAAVLPERRLTWHYRSRSPALVEFSNRRYYDGRLRTFPDPELDAVDADADTDIDTNTTDTDTGFDFEYVAGGVYDRGRTRTNPREADRVVDIVKAHAETAPEKSLGVVAFSRAQTQAISDLLEQRRAANPVLDEFVGDGDDVQEEFFVKSLERVQGDERDRIVFSVGYGPDTDGTVTMNFGPLNEAGGERRLNVAITRARRRVTVVTSLQPEDIDTSRTDSRGVEDFQRYLEYVRDRAKSAEKRGSSADADTGRSFETPLPSDVCETLTARGFDVDPSPGGDEGALEMAIRNPERLDRYVLGIECDGSIYRRVDGVRGRERLRQQVLGDRDWTVHRIWAPAWATDPEREIERIATRVANLVGREAATEFQQSDHVHTDTNTDANAHADTNTHIEAHGDTDTDAAIHEPEADPP